MIPNEIADEASSMGFESVEEITLRSGETVYLLVSDGRKVGLPMYLHYVDGVVLLSSAKQSMALFDEPAYMEDEQ